jgi:hypothetical protein
MIAIDSPKPMIRVKQTALDVQDLEGLLRVHWKIKNLTLHSSFYTRIDQVFLLWGLIAAIIFFTAQFAPINWGVDPDWHPGNRSVGLVLGFG